MPKYLTGRSKLKPQSQLTEERYRYLSISDAEPNLGDPLTGPSSIGAKPVPVGQQYIVVTIGGETGERYWIPNQGGLIPGAISVFDEGTLTPVGGLSSITQLNFVGAAVSVRGFLNLDGSPGIAATVSVFAPGNNQELLFNTSGDFSTSSKLTFDSANGLLRAGDKIFVGAGGTVITTTADGLVGIKTENPTQELDVNGDIRLRGTIYDYVNSPGAPSEILVKNVFGGVTWVDQSTIRAGAGGTYRNVQFHNSVGLVDGAPNFVYNEITNTVGIGSTLPTVTLDVLGTSNFNGQTRMTNLNVSGVTTTSTLAVSGGTTTRNLQVSGVTTLGFLNGTSALYSGIVTAVKFNGAVDVTNLFVTGISTFNQKVNINSNLGVTGLTTTGDLTVYGTLNLSRLYVTGVSTFTSQLNVNNLNVTGVGTFDNIKLDTNTVSTNSGNLILDSFGGTTQINDAVYVNSTVESTSKDTGSIITEGGVGIEKNLNVGGSFSVSGAASLASSGGITTTGGDLYVGGDLYIKDDLNLDEVNARSGNFTQSLITVNFNATGISTIASLRLANAGVAVTAILDEDNMISNRDDALATQQSIKAYVDNKFGDQNLDFSGDTGTGSIDLDTQVFDIGGVVGDIKTTASGQSLTIESDVTGVVAGTYGSATRVGILTVNSKGKITAASDVPINISGLNADTASRLQTPRVISFSEDVVAVGRTFDGSQNVGFALTLAKVFNAGTYGGDGTKVLSLTVDDKGRIIGVSSVNINFGLANVATADSLSNARNIAATGDISWNVNFKGDKDVSGIATLSDTGVIPNTYGSETQIPVITVDSKGRITGVALSTVNGGGGGVGAAATSSDRVSTGSTTGTGNYFLTFVDSNNDPRESEYLYTDGQIIFNAGTNTLNPLNLTVTQKTELNGNVDIGDSSTDTVLFKAGVGGTITPSVNNAYDLGSTTLRWKTVHAQNFCGNFSGTITGASDLVSVASTDGTQEPYYMTFVANTIGNEKLYSDAGLRYYPTTNELALDSNLLMCDNASICVGDSKEFSLTYCLGNFAYDSQGVYEGPGLNPTDRLNRFDISGNRIGSQGKAAIFEEVGTGPVLFRALGSGEGAFQFFSTNTNHPGCVTDPEQWVSLLKMHGGQRGIRFFQCDANLEVLNITGIGLTVAGNIEPWVGLNPQPEGRTSTCYNFTSGTFNLGTPTKRWNTVYADNICATNITGTISGAASQVSVANTNGSQAPYFLTFVGGATGNQNVYTDSGIQYNSVSNSLTVAGDTRICGILTVGASSITLDGSANTVTVGAGVTIGSTTTLNQLRVNSTSTFWGTITPAVNNTYNLGSPSAQWGTIYAQNFSGNIAGSADQVKTQCNNNFATYYLTFVDSNNTSATAETIYTNSEIVYCNRQSGRSSLEVNGVFCTIAGGSGNVLFGDYQTGEALTSGSGNVLLGSGAGYKLTTGGNNVFIGQAAGAFPGATGVIADSNTAVGAFAGQAMVTNSCRTTFIGYGAGDQAGFFTGAFAGSGVNDFNIAMGYYSGSKLTGDYNVVIGNQTACNSCGSQNIIMGSCAGQNGFNANAIFLGNSAGLSISAVHNEDIIIGCGAGQCHNGSNGRNILIGPSAGCNLTNANNNTFIGRCSGLDVTSGINNIAIGRLAGNETLFDFGTIGVTCSNQIVIGNNDHTRACIKVNWSVPSDIRYKCVWGSVPHGREFLRGVNPIKYSFKDEDTNDIIDDTVRYGFSAQEILALEGDNPVIVSADNPERYGLTSDHMIPVLVNAIKELDAENTNLKQRLEAIEQRLGISA